MGRRKAAEYEARITVYRNGRRIDFNDAHSDTPSHALYLASNDLENRLQDYMLDHPDEFDR